MIFILVYDVVDNKRRNRLHRTLKNYGTPVQKSVFEFDLSPKEAEAMTDLVTQIVKEGEDIVRIYRLCSSCQPQTIIIGEGELSIDPDFYIV